MNKLINANLGGRSFAIDEDAYLRLKSYLDAIRDKFRGEKFVDEVVTDIETHAAEQFAVKHGAGHIISLRDVEELIARVGKAEDLIGETSSSSSSSSETSDNTTSNSGTAASGRKTRRLYRNPDDMIIAGVASGIAAYFGIDPVIVRLIFVLMTLAGASGILVYLVFWLIVPLAETPSEKLEMRGEPVTLENIEATVKEKFAQARVEETIQRTKAAAKPALHRVMQFFKNVFGGLFSALGGILSVVFVVVCFGFLILAGFIMVQIMLGLLGYGMWHGFR